MQRRSFLAGAAALSTGSLVACGDQPVPAAGKSTKEILESAPVQNILIDNSASSPATEPAVMNAVTPLILAKVAALPPGATILVNTVGDSRINPLMLRTRVQQRASAEGAPAEDIARSLKRLLLDFPRSVAGHEHGSSHLIGGLHDAALNLNPKSDRNEVVYITDLVEYSPLARCDRRCILPAPSFSLKNVRVTVYGAGLHMSSQNSMALISAWRTFFERAGAIAEIHRLA